MLIGGSNVKDLQSGLIHYVNISVEIRSSSDLLTLLNFIYYPILRAISQRISPYNCHQAHRYLKSSQYQCILYTK